MRHTIFFILFIQFFCFTARAQNYYWIAFTDKNNSPYSLAAPENYLSERAIERREKQNIPIDSLDLPVNTNYIDSVLTLNVELVHASKWLNGVTVKTDLDNVDEIIMDWSFVKEVQLTKPNTISKSTRNKFEKELNEESPSDPSYYGESFNQLDMLNGQYFHEKNLKGQNMHIAVIDAGFIDADELPAFDSLWQNNQILGTKDILKLNTGIFDTPGDYHGMSVLSCMGGNVPGQLIGTAPKASFWLIRSEDISSECIVEEDNWIVAAEFADSVGVDIINSSLGYYIFDDPSVNHTYADMDGKTTRVTQGANVAASRGILVCTSAGNERNDPWQRIIAPSDGDLVIGVGAVDKDLVPAYFTSAGPASDGDIKPNVAAMGSLTVLQKSNGTIGVANGTSFSSPVMAGMAACLWQENPDKTSAEIKEVIEMSGHQFNMPDSLLGYGVPNMAKASELLNTTSVADKMLHSDWIVYPNPFQNKIVLENTIGRYREELTIELYSINGQLLKQWNKPGAQKIVLSDIPELGNGMFLIQISAGQKAQTFKLSKSK